jgi:MoaD family protein
MVLVLEIKVRFFTNLREIIGKREETLVLAEDNLTVASVLKTLSKKYGHPFDDYVYDDKTKNPRKFLQFLINGTSISTLNRFETELKDNDVLAILPPVGGG